MLLSDFSGERRWLRPLASPCSAAVAEWEGSRVQDWSRRSGILLASVLLSAARVGTA
jgi:hypothetical protein